MCTIFIWLFWRMSLLCLLVLNRELKGKMEFSSLEPQGAVLQALTLLGVTGFYHLASEAPFFRSIKVCVGYGPASGPAQKKRRCVTPIRLKFTKIYQNCPESFRTLHSPSSGVACLCKACCFFNDFWIFLKIFFMT